MDEKDYIMSDGDFLFNKSAVVDELKDIYTTLDGPDDVLDINSIEAMIEKVAEAAEDSGGITPTGTLSITSNGLHDVTNYASVAVSVPTPSFLALTITNNTAFGLYAWDYKYDSDSGYIYHYKKTIAKNATVTINVPYTSNPWTTPITVWPDYECILKCATSAGDISSMTVTSQTANINAIVVATYRSSDSADDNMRAVIKIQQGIPDSISEVKITLA